ncbi:MAG: PDZ domain-containing protein [Actinobacteria bacterium]|nr:PDZ domain-containing protein [Actinomycetota bacterium]
MSGLIETSDGRPADLSPRSRQAVVSFVLLVLVGAVLALLPVPFVALSPGPTFNTIGAYDKTPLITITQTTTYRATGHLDLVTIRETGGPEGGLDVFTALRAWFDPNIDIVPRSVLYPPRATAEQVRQENKEMFADSQGEAVAAAMSYLKIPTTLRVIAGSVSMDGPSAKAINPGDEFLRVNGVRTKTPQEVVTAIRSVSIGSIVTLTMRSRGKVSTVKVTTKEHPEHPGRPERRDDVRTRSRGQTDSGEHDRRGIRCGHGNHRHRRHSRRHRRHQAEDGWRQALRRAPVPRAKRELR